MMQRNSNNYDAKTDVGTKYLALGKFKKSVERSEWEDVNTEKDRNRGLWTEMIAKDL